MKVKVKVILLSLIMVLTLQVNVFAADQVQFETGIDEQPSAWASDGVKWSSLYGLVDNDFLSKYQANINKEELLGIGVNLYERLTGKEITPISNSPFTDASSENILKACAIKIVEGKGKLEPKKAATRLDVTTVIYKTIKAAYPGFNFKADIKLNQKDAVNLPASVSDIVKYIHSKNILKGKSNDFLGLNSLCTRQEIMVVATRAYEFSIYESGTASKGPFWKVSDDDSSVYLLGSIHIADPSLYPLSQKILDAFEESDSLVLEIDLANLTQTDAIQYMQQKMAYQDGDTLDKNVPKELYDSFIELCKKNGIPEIIARNYKPWAAAMLAQNFLLAESNMDASLGIDMFFTTKAIGKKEILEIEGTKFQVDLFDSFSKELQVQYLSGILGSENPAAQQIDVVKNLLKAWKEGNISDLEKMLELEEDASIEMKEFNENLIIKRNDNMTKKVKEYLADPSGKTYFIVVGAGHMVGDNGIATQLKNDYTLEQIK
ncbi:MAG TPA: TraB/GumN family protein [Pseudobacteroides sp.]|nr:TraB/GumN family protein [Pseudobacteroides sp.]